MIPKVNDFVAIDFETGNSQRVSACAIGFVKVSDCKVVEAKDYLIKPIGGHASFQSHIHGITNEHTIDKPNFGELFPNIRDIFDFPLVAHSLFDKQVLCALSGHFDLSLKYNYIDSCSMARERIPSLKNYKLPTLVKHFNLPIYKRHDAKEDALACANVFLRLQDQNTDKVLAITGDEHYEFKRLLWGIFADKWVNYKEAYELLYWLEDHPETAQKQQKLFSKIREILDDAQLDRIEVIELGYLLIQVLKEVERSQE